MARRNVSAPISRVAMSPAAETRGQRGQIVQLSGEIARDRAALGAEHLGRKIALLADEACVGVLQLRAAILVDQQTRQVVDHLIAGRARDRPIGAQLFVRSKNFLDDDVEVVPDGAAQSREVGERVGESVDVVDAQAVDQAVPHKREHRAMHILEDIRLLDLDPDQLGDLEKAPVREILPRRAPMRQSPHLLLQQTVQRFPVARDVTRCPFERSGRGGVAECNRKLRLELNDPRRRRRCEAKGQRAKTVLARGTQDAGIARRIEGQLHFTVGDAQLTGCRIDAQLQRSGLQDGAIVVAQARHDQLRCRPVDVEMAGISTCRAPLQRVPPPRIQRAGAHMVGNDVENNAHAGRLHGARQGDEAVIAPQLGLDGIEVYAVVTVRRTRDRLKDRR